MKKGLLVLHYGTPKSIEDVLPYYTHIRRGRPPSDEALADLVGRYEAIGGPSPLTKISEDQAAGIHAGLARRGIEAEMAIGTKHTSPFVADAVRELAAKGCEDVVGIVLAPHFSTYSVAAYEHYAFGAKPEGMRLVMVQRWGLPEFIDALAERIAPLMEGWDPQETLVIFSAHSLPEKIVANGDPYQSELMETSRLVADKLSIPHWTFAFQSASTTGEPWLGPDILDVISENAPNYRNVLSCTVGFVSEHLEVLYDLGIEARDRCAELGLQFRRAATVGADPRLMDALGGLCASFYASE